MAAQIDIRGRVECSCGVLVRSVRLCSVITLSTVEGPPLAYTPAYNVLIIFMGFWGSALKNTP